VRFQVNYLYCNGSSLTKITLDDCEKVPGLAEYGQKLSDEAAEIK